MVGHEAFARAMVYARSGHVHDVDFDDQALVITGRVKGTYRDDYEVTVPELDVMVALANAPHPLDDRPTAKVRRRVNALDQFLSPRRIGKRRLRARVGARSLHVA